PCCSLSSATAPNPGPPPPPPPAWRRGGHRGPLTGGVINPCPAPQTAAAMASRESFQAELAKAGYDRITTEIADVPPFYYAEAYHQQYLAKNPNGYCGLGGTGVCLPA
ncbi:peptide-methionine (S)-S-oxide reductase, partial [Pseudomonas aeruginosa]|uniref:peptide-methionine (S)-S-oxide reductase n=1 Tax=Pseudomonas aeruginosa TaxID=287 RepID=UPI0021F23FF1